MKTHNEALADVVAAAEKLLRHQKADLFLGRAPERKLAEEEAEQIAEGLTLLLAETLGIERSGAFAQNGIALREAGEELAAALDSLHATREG